MAYEQDPSPVSTFATFVCDDESCWCSQYYGMKVMCRCTGCHAEHTVNNLAPPKKLRWDGSSYRG